MAREDFEKPVYLITGFLESGKTTFLDGTIRQNYFQIPETTLLILCEEGEEEYDEKELKKRYRTVVEVIEEPEDFTTESLEYLDRKHHPERILVEFNPLWSVEKFLNMLKFLRKVAPDPGHRGQLQPPVSCLSRHLRPSPSTVAPIIPAFGEKSKLR